MKNLNKLILILFVLLLSSCYINSDLTEYPYRDEPMPRPEFRIYWYPYPYSYWSQPYYWVPPPPKPYMHSHPQQLSPYIRPRRR
jgi:hypothetical protein